VHRNWADLPSQLDSMGVEKEEKPNSIKKLISQVPQSLHGQFHGREIHSVHFVPAGNIQVTSGQHVRKWIATGAEDGAVRISRLDSSEFFLMQLLIEIFDLNLEANLVLLTFTKTTEDSVRIV
jgi:hypothetical protein